MRKFTVSVFINNSQQDVFDFLSNVANFQRWMPIMQSAAWYPAVSLILVQPAVVKEHMLIHSIHPQKVERC